MKNKLCLSKMHITCILCDITEVRYVSFDNFKYKEYVCVDCEIKTAIETGFFNVDGNGNKMEGITTYKVPVLSAGIK